MNRSIVALHPLPNPPHKGEGVRRFVWHTLDTNTERHLPPCGGGWEGGVTHTVGTP
jgi:hypothetical protein